jgi:hypothetical protein
MDRIAVTLKEAAQMMGMPARTLDQATRDGKGPPHFKREKSRYYPVAKLKEWAENEAAGMGGGNA